MMPPSRLLVLIVSLAVISCNFDAVPRQADSHQAPGGPSTNPSTAPEAVASSTTVPVSGIPTDWVDAATGHRVIRLSTENGSQSLYFHQQAYTAAGDKMFITTPSGLATVDLTTLGRSSCKVEMISEGQAGAPCIGARTRIVYYARGNRILATHLDTHETREVCTLPQGLTGASGIAINADETLLASTGNDPDAAAIVATQPAPPRSAFTPPPATTPATVSATSAPGRGRGRGGRGAGRGGRGEGGRSMCLFTINIATGEIKKILYSTSWLNHTQFSPTDPAQILFCHEGNWQDVDRIWTIRTDGTGLSLMHTRTMPNEIAGHEFFSFDGKTILYDLQTPRSGQFWLGGTDLATGHEFRYPLQRVQWSVHFNQSHDGKLFSGDGGGPNSVANHTPLPENRELDPPGNGMWLYLFTPQSAPSEQIQVAGKTVNVGKFSAERLVSLAHHDYTLEPNARFSPDNKWLIFRSNMYGNDSHVYAVELRRSR